jgi:two-component system, OmpR family, response regulator ResD
MVQSPSVILVVDDDATISELLQRLLEAEGYLVEAAADGVAGLAAMEDGSVDLVLLDVMMPLMNGLEVCRELRARERRGQRQGHLPVIMLTALGSAEQARAGLNAGADDYITKPFGVEEILERVRAWIQTGARVKRLDRPHQDED